MTSNTIHVLRSTPSGRFYVQVWSLTWNGDRYEVKNHLRDTPAEALVHHARRYGHRPVLFLADCDRNPTIEALERLLKQPPPPPPMVWVYRPSDNGCSRAKGRPVLLIEYSGLSADYAIHRLHLNGLRTEEVRRLFEIVSADPNTEYGIMTDSKVLVSLSRRGRHYRVAAYDLEPESPKYYAE